MTGTPSAAAVDPGAQGDGRGAGLGGARGGPGLAASPRVMLVTVLLRVVAERAAQRLQRRLLDVLQHLGAQDERHEDEEALPGSDTVSFEAREVKNFCAEQCNVCSNTTVSPRFEFKVWDG